MMQMGSERGNVGGRHYQYQWLNRDPTANAIAGSPSRANSLPSSIGGGVGYIQHPISKMDTLAGIAIKYGVEVADIRKMNGLVADSQMFALKSLQIPTPGKHPPSPCLSNGSATPGRGCVDHSPLRRHSDLFESFQSLKMNYPQEMSSLQGFYGIPSANGKTATSEGFEMAMYTYREDELLANSSPPFGRPLSRHRKSKSLANGFGLGKDGLAGGSLFTEAKETDSHIRSERLIRRRQKSEDDFSSQSSVQLLKEDNIINGSGGGFSAITGKGLCLRPKATNRITMAGEAEAGLLNPVGLGDSFVDDGYSVVRKSSSTPSLQDQDNTCSMLVRPSAKWSMKPDLPPSSAVITRPIFNGLPKPISSRKNKAALD